MTRAVASGGYVNPLRPSESLAEATARRERETARIVARTKVWAARQRRHHFTVRISWLSTLCIRAADRARWESTLRLS